MLRILLAVNLLAFGAALARNGELGLLPRELVELAALVEPPLIAAVLLLYAANRSLARLPYAAAVTAIGVAGAVLAALFQALLSPPGLPLAGLPRAALWGALVAATILAYFDLRNRAYSPAAGGGAIAGADRAHPSAFSVQQHSMRYWASYVPILAGQRLRSKSCPTCSAC
jgi:two-component system sensor histidine kinase AlgZ